MALNFLVEIAEVIDLTGKQLVGPKAFHPSFDDD